MVKFNLMNFLYGDYGTVSKDKKKKNLYYSDVKSSYFLGR